MQAKKILGCHSTLGLVAQAALKSLASQQQDDQEVQAILDKIISEGKLIWEMPKVQEPTPSPMTIASLPEKVDGWDSLYPRASSSVSGLSVNPSVPNMSSISSSLVEYVVLPGIRSVPVSAIPAHSPRELFYAQDDLARVKKLASEISSSKSIKPLIVVVDQQGPYILEGAHRLGALHSLGISHFPAVVVITIE